MAILMVGKSKCGICHQTIASAANVIGLPGV